MIHVSKLTKFYGDYPAIQGVSFDVDAGQVVGFLGPNGAGKSTTMRILAGYLTATSGRATVAGLDVFWDSVAVRRQIGYMPESCPLYHDMRVREYLHFRAGIKGVYGAERRRRIDYVLGRCWLADVQRQLIGTLSKGYRQRVGLADALLTSPPVLILDEPTAGLDPAQIRETRGLIKELGAEHTVLLSTHILSEVEAACDSVIIIHGGRVAVSSSLAGLREHAAARAGLLVVLDGSGDVDQFRALPGVSDLRVSQGGDGQPVRLHVGTPDTADLAPRLCRFAAENHWNVLEVRPERATLEDLFVQITSGEFEGPVEAELRARA